MSRLGWALCVVGLSVSGAGCSGLPWADEATQMVDATASHVGQGTESTPPPTGPPDQPPSCASDPVAMVRGAYAPYLSGQSPAPLSRATCWSAKLQGAIAAAEQQAEASGKCVVCFDPLVDAQDYELDALMIERASDREVIAHFTNHGRPQSIHWTLDGPPDALRVVDLHTDRWRLSERLQP